MTYFICYKIKRGKGLKNIITTEHPIEWANQMLSKGRKVILISFQPVPAKYRGYLEE